MVGVNGRLWCVSTIILCGMPAPLCAQSESGGDAATVEISRPVPISMSPPAAFGQVIQAPAGPPPTPRHTGIKALVKGLFVDFKYVPSRENLMWAGIGGGLLAAKDMLLKK